MESSCPSQCPLKVQIKHGEAELLWIWVPAPPVQGGCAVSSWIQLFQSLSEHCNHRCGSGTGRDLSSVCWKWPRALISFPCPYMCKLWTRNGSATSKVQFWLRATTCVFLKETTKSSWLSDSHWSHWSVLTSSNVAHEVAPCLLKGGKYSLMSDLFSDSWILRAVGVRGGKLLLTEHQTVTYRKVSPPRNQGWPRHGSSDRCSIYLQRSILIWPHSKFS